MPKDSFVHNYGILDVIPLLKLFRQALHGSHHSHVHMDVYLGLYQDLNLLKVFQDFLCDSRTILVNLQLHDLNVNLQDEPPESDCGVSMALGLVDRLRDLGPL